jgi:hypothetical protein
MSRRLRSLLIALLLVPVLTLNAQAFTAPTEDALVKPAEQSSGYCWFYFGSRWWLLPC